MNQKEFIKGFNYGYILASADLNLNEKISINENAQNDFLMGLKAGQGKFLEERDKLDKSKALKDKIMEKYSNKRSMSYKLTNPIDITTKHKNITKEK